MQSTLRPLVVVLMVFLMGATLTHAESPDFSTVVETVDKLIGLNTSALYESASG